MPAWTTRLTQAKLSTKAGIGMIVLLLGSAAGLSVIKRSSPKEGLNISCFSYRDINRNGVYDLGDRPYAGLSVRLERPDSPVLPTHSNLSGFANFTMSGLSAKADVRAPGPHAYLATAPAGWTITSGNSVQRVGFKRLPGSPVGLVADKLCSPIGIAPVLTISGSLRGSDADRPGPQTESLIAVSPKGERFTVAISAAGRFSVPAESGEWQLIHTGTDGQRSTRRVAVADSPVVLATFEPSANREAPVGTARLIRFDDLTPSDTLLEIPNGYAGLGWSNWVAVHQKLYRAKGYVNGAVSSEYVAYNSSGHPAQIHSATPFDLESFHLAVAFAAAEAHEVVVRAWRGDKLVHEDRFKPTANGPLKVDADYRGITRVEFASTAYWQLVVDDMTVRLNTP